MPSYAILGTPGFVREPARFDPETLLKVLGANSGNLMFQYATSKIIDAKKYYVSLAEIPYSETAILKEVKALVFPAANHLRVGADWSGLNGYLANFKGPLIVLGLGAQSPGLRGEASTIASLKADPHVKRLAAILREKAVFVSVRGSFSKLACEELGIDNAVELGCPSLLLNPDPHLGSRMAAKLASVRAESDEIVRLAMTAAAPFEIAEDQSKLALERQLVEWTAKNNGLYIQQSGGVASMRAAGGRWSELAPGPRKSIAKLLAPKMDLLEFEAFMRRAGRFYLSAPEWCSDMERLDLVLGTRLHGNMAAVAGGTPGVVIAHDSRTNELAETMHLPRLEMADIAASSNLQSAMARIRFDGAAFDARRLWVARALTTSFDNAGVPVSDHVRSLARAQLEAVSREHETGAS